MVQLILNLLSSDERYPWIFQECSFSYNEDKTQWEKGNSPIEIDYKLLINRSNDSELTDLLAKLTNTNFITDEVCVDINIKVISEKDEAQIVKVEGKELDSISQRQFLSQLKNSDNLFAHNSTKIEHHYYVSRGRHAIMYDLSLSPQDRKAVRDAEKSLEKELKKVARNHKQSLKSMLGKLSDDHDVEFSTLDMSMYRHVPLTINISDKNVELPITSWGSGTQNRTHILLSILRANRIKTKQLSSSTITPIVLVEEPESFLHPSAQAEFGAVLQALSEELSIQIIASTHSPFMLNQKDPRSNILLKRRIFRRKALETIVEDTSGNDWMKPFAEHLGIVPREFENWRGVIASGENKVLLVEGTIDEQYFSFLREKLQPHFPIETDIVIKSYGGKDALKNTSMVAFVRSVVGRLFITFDLDAKSEIQKSLEGIGMVEKRDFLPIGKNRVGYQAIEGLLPKEVFSAVYATEIDLVNAVSSADPKQRRSARQELKRKLFDEFSKRDNYSAEDMKDFRALAVTINKAFK